MKSTRKQIAFVICVVLVALAALPLGACDDKNAGGTGRVKPADGGEVLAVAGGQDITQKQVDALCAFATAAQGSSLDTLTDAKKQELSNQMLVFAADNVLIKNAAEKADKTVAENAAAEIEQQYEQFLIQTPTVAEQVSSGALSAGTVKDYLAAQYYYYAFSEQVAKDQPPSEGAIQQVYEQYQDQFVTPESISLRHILIMNPTKASESGINRTTEDARTSIEAIYKRVKDGEDFAKLAKKYSEDPGSAENGGLYESVTKGEMVPAFDEAAFKLKKSEISGIVESEEYGFFIIKAESDVVPEQKMPLESVRSDIVSYLTENEIVPAAIEKLKAEDPVKYNVEVDPATGEPPQSIPEPTTGSAVTGGGVEGASAGAATDDGSASQ